MIITNKVPVIGFMANQNQFSRINTFRTRIPKICNSELNVQTSVNLGFIISVR